MSCKGINSKICSDCKSEKTIAEFPKGRRQCKECRSKLDYFDETLDPNITTKQCCGVGGCKKTLTLCNFTLCKTGQFGYSNLCKDCRKVKRRINTNEDPDYEGTKICCGLLCRSKELLKTEFDKDKFSGDGLQSVCKKCFKIKHGICKSQLEPFIVKIVKDTRNRIKAKASAGRILAFDIDKEFIVQLYKQQGGKCAITKIEMMHNSVNERTETSCHIMNPYNLSIDRIDSEIGYTKENVRLVCAFVNKIRMDMSDEDFIQMCKDVATEHKGKKVNVDEIVETKQFDKFVEYKLSNAKHGAKARNLDFELKHGDIVNIYKKQRGKCIFTKNRFTYDVKNKKDTDFSIDRINCNKEYIISNIQLVENKINISKSDIPDEDYIEFCRTIANNF